MSPTLDSGHLRIRQLPDGYWIVEERFLGLLWWRQIQYENLATGNGYTLDHKTKERAEEAARRWLQP